MYPVVITGSRQWSPTNVDQIEAWIIDMVELYPDLEIAHGQSAGGGVDLYVAQICERLGVPDWPYPVRPDLDGRVVWAPLARNERMIKGFMPVLVQGFRSSGKSNGTDKTLKFAAKLGITTDIIYERGHHES